MQGTELNFLQKIAIFLSLHLKTYWAKTTAILNSITGAEIQPNRDKRKRPHRGVFFFTYHPIHLHPYQRWAFALDLKIMLFWDSIVCPFTCDFERLGLVQLW